MDEEVYGISFVMQRPVVKKLSITDDPSKFDYKAQFLYSRRYNGNASGTITLEATDEVHPIVVRGWELYPVISFDFDWGGKSFSLFAKKQGEENTITIKYSDGVSYQKCGPGSIALGLYELLLKYCSLGDYLSSAHYQVSELIRDFERKVELLLPSYKQSISLDEAEKLNSDLLSFKEEISLLIENSHDSKITSSIIKMLEDLNVEMKRIPPVSFACMDLVAKLQKK